MTLPSTDLVTKHVVLLVVMEHAVNKFYILKKSLDMWRTGRMNVKLRITD
jgi:hypothetical protein